MEEISNKPSRIPIKNYTDASVEKINNLSSPAANAHGIKLSMNMSSEAKRDFFLKFEEWRKKKREMLIEKACEVKKNENHQTKTECFATTNKTFSSTGKKVMHNFQGRDSVFERLYRNSKGVHNKGKENAETINEVFSKKVGRPVVPGLKKKNDIMLKAGKFQKNHNTIKGKVTLPANNSELQTNIVVGGRNDIAENNDIDNIVKVTNNLPRTTFVVATKEMPISEISNSENDFESEEAISKSDEKMVESAPLKSVEETTDKNCNTNDPFFNCDIFEENQEALNKTFNCGANSIEIEDRVSQRFKASQPLIKPFSAKLNVKQNYKFCNSKQKNYVINELEGKKPQMFLRKSISSIYFQKCGIPQKSTIKNIPFERNHHALKLASGKKEIDEMFKGNNKEKKNLSAIKGIPSTPLHKKNLTSSSLRNKLEDWLTQNNHSLEGYRHLRCFGFNDTSDIIGQTPIKTIKKNFNDNYIEEVSIKEEDDCNKENLSPSTPTEQFNLCEDENRLKELYQLIVDLKYEPDRCEDWLIAIRKKNPRVTDLPIYWECLAALNQDNEVIKSAVEQYEKALANEEENSTDNALAQLFDKLLIDQQKPNEHKLEKGIDPKNIFRSTVIKFSLQQKVTKESTAKEGEENNTVCKYVATPVRRSSRLWTPHKNNVVNSLQGLNPQIRENVTFKTNDSLLN